MSRMRAADRICLACRVTTLSQYNPDPLCSACERASRDTAGIVPTWLWDSDPMREALARVDIPAVVAIFRAASSPIRSACPEQRYRRSSSANRMPPWTVTTSIAPVRVRDATSSQ